MPRTSRKTALFPSSRVRTLRTKQQVNRLPHQLEERHAKDQYSSLEIFPPSPREQIKSPQTAFLSRPTHGHVKLPAVYAPTRTYVPVRVADFVAVAADRFADVTDVLGPIDSARRPPSYQLYPPSSLPTSSPPSYRHSLPPQVHVGVQVNETNPFLNHSSSTQASVNPCPCNHQSNGAAHRVENDNHEHPTTFRASAQSHAHHDDPRPPQQTQTGDIFLIDDGDYVSRLCEIISSHNHNSLSPHSRPHSYPCSNVRSNPYHCSQHHCQSTKTPIHPGDLTDQNIASVESLHKLPPSCSALQSSSSLEASRASTLLSTLSMGTSTSSENNSVEVTATSSETAADGALRQGGSAEEVVPPPTRITIPGLLNFADVLAISSLSPCHSPSPGQTFHAPDQPSQNDSNFSVQQELTSNTQAFESTDVRLYPVEDDAQSCLSDVQPFPPPDNDAFPGGCNLGGMQYDTTVESAARLEQLSEIFGEDEFENDFNPGLEHFSERGGRGLEIPSDSSIFVAVSSTQSLSDIVSVQGDECTSPVGYHGGGTDGNIPRGHVIPSLWLRPNTVERSDPLSQEKPGVPQSVRPVSTPGTGVDRPGASNNAAHKLSAETKAVSASGNENDGSVGSPSSCPTSGGSRARGGHGTGANGSGSISLSPTKLLFRKSWSRRKSSESGLTSSSTEYYEDDYLKFMEGKSISSPRPPLRLLPHPAFARLIGTDGRALRVSRFDCAGSTLSVSTSDEEYRPFCGNTKQS